MLSAGALASMRASAAAALPDSATVADYGVADDGGGGHTEIWTPRAQPVKVRIGSADDRAAAPFASRLAGKAAFVATLEALTPIDERDRLTVAGATYGVVAVLAPESWEIDRRVLVVQEG